MALPSGMVWEEEFGGSDANNGGGGFNSARGGADFSKSTSPHVTIDGSTVTCTVQSTTTRVKLTGYTVTTNDAGNTCQLTINGTTQVYEIQSVDTGNSFWNLDKVAGTNGQTGTGAMGGAAQSAGFICSKAVTGNNIWAKYNATPYSISSTSNNVSGGRFTLPANCTFQGYDQTRGDFTGNRPKFQATTNNIQPICTATNNFNAVVNCIFDAGSATGIDGLNVTIAGSYAYLCKVLGMANAYGIQLSGGQAVLCEATTCSIAPFKFGANGGNLMGCVSLSNTTNGFTLSNRGSLAFCIASGNTGDGFLADSVADALYNCIAYNNTGHGFNANSPATIATLLINCVASTHTGVGKAGFNNGQLFNCAGFDNTADTTAANVASTSFVSCSADPFTNAAGGDFSLNRTANGGALLAAAGICGIFPDLISSTGKLDIGAVQEAFAASQFRNWRSLRM